ncbi:hypothetical protein EI94DRAFT_1707343 [Lactarius quietus]|nr:hypothetical protein EI94DRAFT_1707343 [Lactarius quietus]
MDKAAESLAEAMTGVAKTLMQPWAVSPELPANTATKDAHMTATTDSRKTAIQIIEEEEGFSDNDLASAANCIISNEELAKIQHWRVAVFWADTHRGKVDRFHAHAFSEYLLLKLGTPTSEFIFKFLCVGNALTVGARIERKGTPVFRISDQNASERKLHLKNNMKSKNVHWKPKEDLKTMSNYYHSIQ